jgi:hypothetical protein
MIFQLISLNIRSESNVYALDTHQEDRFQTSRLRLPAWIESCGCKYQGSSRFADDLIAPGPPLDGHPPQVKVKHGWTLDGREDM